MFPNGENVYRTSGLSPLFYQLIHITLTDSFAFQTTTCIVYYWFYLKYLEKKGRIKRKLLTSQVNNT